MIEATVKITHGDGLHSRPAAIFVQVAGRFKSWIWVEKGSKKVNAKSIMGVMSLGVSSGNEIVLIFDGKDEKAAREAMVALVESNFTKT